MTDRSSRTGAPKGVDTPQNPTLSVVPDTPEALFGAPIESQPIPSTAELIAAWEREQTAGAPTALPGRAADAPSTAPATLPGQPAGPLVPSWAVKTTAITAVTSLALGVVAFVVWGISWLLAQAGHLLHEAEPVLWWGGAGLAVLLVLAGRTRRASVTVTQTTTIRK